MALGFAAGTIPLCGAAWFLYGTEGLEQYLFVIPVTLVTLIVALVRGFRKGVMQNIILEPKQMVFNWVTGTQSFNFNNARDWNIKDKGGSWILESAVDGSNKKIANKAFPNLYNRGQTTFNIRRRQ